MSRTDSDTIISGAEKGDFLVRESESKAGAFTFVVNFGERAIHLPIAKTGGKFTLQVIKGIYMHVFYAMHLSC
jgi:hypothetical protein